MEITTTAPDDAPRRRKWTLLLDQDEALRFDELVVEMRRRTGRAVDKSEIVRQLLRLAEASPPINAALGKALSPRETPDETP